MTRNITTCCDAFMKSLPGLQNLLLVFNRNALSSNHLSESALKRLRNNAIFTSKTLSFIMKSRNLPKRRSRKKKCSKYLCVCKVKILHTSFWLKLKFLISISHTFSERKETENVHGSFRLERHQPNSLRSFCFWFIRLMSYSEDADVMAPLFAISLQIFREIYIPCLIENSFLTTSRQAEGVLSDFAYLSVFVYEKFTTNFSFIVS